MFRTTFPKSLHVKKFFFNFESEADILLHVEMTFQHIKMDVKHCLDLFDNAHEQNAFANVNDQIKLYKNEIRCSEKYQYFSNKEHSL